MTNFNLSDVRIFLCATPVKMNYSFDTLMGLAQTVFDQDPLSGHLFLFFNRDRNRVKILFWDQDGFCIWYHETHTSTRVTGMDRGGVDRDARPGRRTDVPIGPER